MLRSILFAALLGVLVGGCSRVEQVPEETPQTTESKIDAEGFREILWEELMPEGEEERLREMFQQHMVMIYSSGPIAEGSAADQAIQIGTFNVVDDLNGEQIKLAGYTVPFEFGPNTEITEFLLVPYFGACLHAPPPPPNQTIYVKTDKPIRITDLSQAVWVRGVLQTEIQESALADTAYTLILEDMVDYAY